MREQFRKSGLLGPKWRFQGETLNERAENIKNPARGWYRIYTFEADREPDFNEMEWCLDKKDALALVLIDIGSYRDKLLDDICLQRMERILAFFRQNQYDVILRITYDHEGRAMSREPSLFRTVATHLTQLSELLESFADTIFVYQGMLVGNWGEMHSSRFLGQNMLRSMAEILYSHKKAQTFLAVRRPVYWRMLHEDAASLGLDGMGLFDDGMFGSESHLGTFGVLTEAEGGWYSAWCREEELAFEEKLCRRVPCGGEAVYPEKDPKCFTREMILQDLKTMHITYLNKEHDIKMLELWKNWRYKENGIWSGKSVYEYIGAHLGYRFVIQRVAMQSKRNSDKPGVLQITIKNTGFAAFYQEALCYLECVDNEGGREVEILDSHMQGWLSGESRTYEYPVRLKEVCIYLGAKRKRDGRAVCFANGVGAGEKIKLGMVLHA